VAISFRRGFGRSAREDCARRIGLDMPELRFDVAVPVQAKVKFLSRHQIVGLYLLSSTIFRNMSQLK